MANSGFKDQQSNVFTGLGTFTRTIKTAGLYNMSAVSNVLPPSGLSIVINQNGSPVVSSSAPSAAQQIVSAQVTDLSCAVNDVITVVVSSSQISDSLPNALQTIINVYLNN